jgi:hypothetical protein
MSYNRDHVNYKEYYKKFGEYREEIVSSALTYRGWAPKDSLDSDAKWIIERESFYSGISHVTQAGTSSSVTSQIWNNRASAFNSVPFTNDFSLLFDGINDYVELGAPAALTKERTDSWSWSFWMKARSLANTTQAIYSKRTSSTTAGISLTLLNNGRIFIDIYNASTARIGQGTNTGSILPGTWYHVVITYAGTSLASGVKIYLNGVFQSVAATADTLGTASVATTATAQFGAMNGTNFFDGNIDEISYWNNYVLSQSEVTALWNDSGTTQGKPGDISQLATYSNCTSWWRCGETSGDILPTLKDAKNVINGTMTNMIAANFMRVTP